MFYFLKRRNQINEICIDQLEMYCTNLLTVRQYSSGKENICATCYIACSKQPQMPNIRDNLQGTMCFKFTSCLAHNVRT